MKTNFQKVQDFHDIFGVGRPGSPTIPDKATISLRIRLMREELAELELALAEGDIVQVAKESADLLYVVYGTQDACGIPGDEVFHEVHVSNLSKLDDNGRPIYDSQGKVLKSHNYREADLTYLKGGDESFPNSNRDPREREDGPSSPPWKVEPEDGGGAAGSGLGLDRIGTVGDGRQQDPLGPYSLGAGWSVAQTDGGG